MSHVITPPATAAVLALRADPVLRQMAAAFRRTPPPRDHVLAEDGTPRLMFMREVHRKYYGSDTTEGIDGDVGLVAEALRPLLYPTLTYAMTAGPDDQPECHITITLNAEHWTAVLRETHDGPLQLIVTRDGFPALDAAPALFQSLAAHQPGSMSEVQSILELLGAIPAAS